MNKPPNTTPNKVYVSHNTVFIPTNQTVSVEYANGKVGDQLWLQIYNGVSVGSMWTLKEIVALNPNHISADKMAMILDDKAKSLAIS